MKIIVCFYASQAYGSEYTSGYEFLQYADKKKFDIAFVSDIEFNKKLNFAKFKHLKVNFIPQDCRSQNELYKKTDFKYCANWLKKIELELKKYKNIDVLWICNPAQIWFPLYKLIKIPKKLIWGPVGGGESLLKLNLILKYSIKTLLKEIIRDLYQYYSLFMKRMIFNLFPQNKIIILARTKSSEKFIKRFLRNKIFYVPERLHPFKNTIIKKEISSSPNFVWVGQDVPRKNIWLTEKIFINFLSKKYPSSKLLIFGAKRLKGTNRIFSKSWVEKVPYQDFKSNGILICTSSREGMPSVILEALSFGMFVITTDVGSVNSLKDNESIHILKNKNIFEEDWNKIYKKIDQHLTKKSIMLKNPNFTEKLDILFDKF